MDVRRVVVGADVDGTTSVWSDGPSPHVHSLPGYPPSLDLVDLWYTDTAAEPGTDTADRDLQVAPDPGGALFRIVHFPPDHELPSGDDGTPALFWHATDTVDFNVVLQGTLAFVFDGGDVTLQAGDTLVVRGGRHAWSNRTNGVVTLATVAVAEVR
jgi:mannose-6-phosphate isomerase-like protein (cupin superfamily)